MTLFHGSHNVLSYKFRMHTYPPLSTHHSHERPNPLHRGRGRKFLLSLPVMLHVCIHLQGGVMERCRLRSEQDISRRLRVDGGRKSRREEEKEKEIGESVVWRQQIVLSQRAVAVNLKTDRAKLYCLFELGKGQSKFQNNPFNKWNVPFNISSSIPFVDIHFFKPVRPPVNLIIPPPPHTHTHTFTLLFQE